MKIKLKFAKEIICIIESKADFSFFSKLFKIDDVK